MITYLIRTNSIDSDDWLAKTVNFLKVCGQSVTVFAVVRALSKSEGEFIEKRLMLREWFPTRSALLLKYLELLFVTARFLTSARGRLWFANFDFIPFHLLAALCAGGSNKPIWDLHEMPPSIVLNYQLLRRVFAYLLRNSHVVVCNDSRRDALEKIFGVQLGSALILRNYPSFETAKSIAEARQKHLSAVSSQVDALQVLIVGGDMPGRYVSESIDVIRGLREQTGLDIRVTLVGGAECASPYKFVESTGYLSFQELIAASVRGRISLCFYRTNTLNNLLCEPNRFYQGLIAGQDVFTFPHPSLDDIRSSQRYFVEEDDFKASLQSHLKELFARDASRKNIIPNLCEDEKIFEKQLPTFDKWLPR